VIDFGANKCKKSRLGIAVPSSIFANFSKIPMPKKPLLPWLLFAYLVLTWGSSFILIKRGLEAFDPFQLAGLRIVIAGLVLAPFILHRAREVSRVEWKYILSVGAIGNAIPAFLFPIAETQLNSATAGILNTLSPLFVLGIGVFFFKLQPSPSQKWGILTGFLGASILVLGGGGEIELIDSIYYSSLVILATLCYGLSTNIMKRFLNKTPSVLASGYALLSMAIPYGIYLSFSGIEEPFVQAHPEVWMSLVYVIILAALGTALALVCFYRLVQVTDPIFSSSVTYAIPIMALFWGLLDGETVYPMQYLGIAAILAGVYLTNKTVKTAKPKNVKLKM
jgi:drug/metabolite transporter (DMT)-like permease